MQKRKPKPKASKQQNVDLIAMYLQAENIQVEREYKFLPNRRFKFDIVIKDKPIAIEYEGGIYTGGSHIRPVRYSSDCEKYRLAVFAGWKVLRYTVADIQRIGIGGIVNEIKELIKKEL